MENATGLVKMGVGKKTRHALCSDAETAPIFIGDFHSSRQFARMSLTPRRDFGIVHFIGIGGSGMSGIAELMHNIGHRVQGSDLNDTATTARLSELGIAVMRGHTAENVAGCAAVVVSSAIPADNAELVAARGTGIPIVGRAEMLAELMRYKHCIAVAGSHGKTTTTSLVATLLEDGGVDPTVVNGGIVNNWNSSSRLGSGEWMVVEADESDGSFVRLPSTLAVVTNIDSEHLDHYGEMDKVFETFESFLRSVPFYGTLILCSDRPELRKLMARITERKIVTFGTNPQATYRAMNIRIGADKRTYFDLRVLPHRAMSPSRVSFDPGVESGAEPAVIEGFSTALLGEHNICNVLAAIVVGDLLGIPFAVLQRALAGFGGVARRFTYRGTYNGAEIYDDYGHHPTEIHAVLSSVRKVSDKRLIAVFQPHRYSRVSHLWDDFCSAFDHADLVYVSEVYAAGEQAIAGIDRAGIVAGMRAQGHRAVLPFHSSAELAADLAPTLAEGEHVVFFGAGTITAWSREFADILNG